MNFSALPQVLVSGLAMGGVYALVASGLTIAYAVSRQINLTHAHFLMLTLYVIIFLQRLWGLDPYTSWLITVPIMFGIGVLVFYILVKPTLGENIIIMFQLFLGALLILQNAVLMVFKTTPVQARSMVSMTIIQLGSGVMLPLAQIIDFLVSIVIGISGYLFLKRTEFGRAIRAVSCDSQAASLMGINVSFVQWSVFGLAFVLIAIAAALVAPIQWVDPNLGLHYLIFLMIVVQVGGLGNFVGALLTGFGLGILQSLGTFIEESTIGLAIPYVCFLIAFILKPRGLLR